jgi:hypothetical protein
LTEEVTVLWTMTVIYVASAIVTTMIVQDTTRPLVKGGRPAHRLGPAMLAGLIWPVMLLGVVEFSLVIALSKVYATNHGEAGVSVTA